MRQVLLQVLTKIQSMQRKGTPFLIAIDGRCAAGKTTFAALLQSELKCNVFHMDHFFLRSEQRTKERLAKPGGNVDYERFLQEVLLPLQKGIPFSYCPYDCHTQSLQAPVWVEPSDIAVIEGSYSCHPALWECYGLHIFLTVSAAEQRIRIRSRNGETGLQVFQDKWIPLEEKYFAAYRVEEQCELCFDTGTGRIR